MSAMLQILCDIVSCDQSPSSPPLCDACVTCQSCPLGKSDVTVQREHLSPPSAGGFLQCPPLPVISQTACSCTLPVTETAAFEEQVAAGHCANLT